MSTAVMTFRKAGLPAVSLKESLQAHQTMRSVTQSGDTFLRLLKSGEWVYGPENILVEENALIAVDPTSIEQGFACWGEGELLGEVMTPAGQQPPTRGELPDHGPAWDDQVSVRMAIISGEDAGTQVLYKTTALGGRQAHAELVNAIVAQLEDDGDPANPVPIIALGADSYRHKKYGQIYTPIFEIKSWTSLDAEEAPEEADKPPFEEDKPVKRTPAKVRADKSEAETSPAPSRRKRTSADVRADKSEAETSPAPSRRKRRAA